MKARSAPSKFGLLLFSLGVTLMICSGCIITSRPPTVKYVLTNSLPVEIQIDAFDRYDKRICHRSIASGSEVHLGRTKRLEIHKSGEILEYALPSNLHFWTPPNAGRPYTSALGGECRISVVESGYLAFISSKGATVGSLPDHTKPPLGFPMRPRKPAEPLEHYRAEIEAIPEDWRGK